MGAEKLENDSIRLDGKTLAEHVLYLLLLMKFSLGGSVKSEFWNARIDGLAFQWLSPDSPLLPLLACVQLGGCYKYAWFSASFQLSYSWLSAPETHYCSFWLVLDWNTCPGFCLALIGRDQMIKYDLSSSVQRLHIPVGMWTKAMSARAAARCVSGLWNCEYYS